MVFGRGVFAEPTQFQVTTAARLLDKSLTHWDSALREFTEHNATRADVREPLLSPKPGVTRAFFRAIDHLETLVDSLARLLRLIRVLEVAPELAQLAGKPLPSPATGSVFNGSGTASRTAMRTSRRERLGRDSRRRPCGQIQLGSSCNTRGLSTPISPACSNRATTTFGRSSRTCRRAGFPYFRSA